MFKDMTDEEIIQFVVTAIDKNDEEALENLLDELHPYDVANIYLKLEEEYLKPFLIKLDIDLLVDLTEELDYEYQVDVLNHLTADKRKTVLNLMDNDDLASLLHELSTEDTEALLEGLSPKEAHIVINMMSYPTETAGRVMTNRFVWIRNYYTVRQAVDKMKSFADYVSSLNYLYVIDEHRKLVGVVSYRDLLLADESDLISEIMFERVISVPATTDQEEVATIAERYDFLAIPVVDEEEKLVGIVTADDIIDIVIHEANEDIGKLSATSKSIDFETKAFTAAYRRLPWLILLLFIGLISGSIISNFEETLEQVVALAFFMPMIAGMTGNTGTQSLAVIVRGLVSNDIDRRVILHVILREFGVGIIIGITCGALITIIAFVWQGSAILGLVVGSSLLLTLIIGTLAGTIIPFILYRFNVDPAVASGPLITTLNDIFSLITYFSIATMFLNYLL